MGSEPNLSVKWCLTIDTMLNFDGDFDGYGHGDGTCKGLFTRTVSVSVSVSITVKVYHCVNGDRPFDWQNSVCQTVHFHWHNVIGGSRGGAWGTHAPPGRPNSFNFMQFSGKFGVFTPPLEGSRPPSGKSWIRHWMSYFDGDGDGDCTCKQALIRLQLPVTK